MLDPDWVLVLALLVPGIICGLGVITIGNLGVLAIAFSIGLGQGVGTRAITILNASVPRLARARTIARSELLFQVASLLGAVLAVQFAPTPNAGFAASSAVLVMAGVAFGIRRRRTLRQHASRLLLGEHAPAIDRTLPDALLMEAQRLASLGAYRMAIVVTASAVDVLVEREPSLVGNPKYARWKDLAGELAEVRSQDEQPTERLVIEALELTEALIDRKVGPGRDLVVKRPTQI